MSFAMTPTQILSQTKTVTRRQGWNKTKVNEELQPVLKGMGLKKGESVTRLGGLIQLISVRNEPIEAITQSDVDLEGFPWMSPDEFVDMYCHANKVRANEFCNRLEFKYLQPLLKPAWQIWSWEHNGWWGSDSMGYLPLHHWARAGQYTLQQANEIVQGANAYMKPGTANEQLVPAHTAENFAQQLIKRYTHN
ncbi:hypothetical protein OAV22_02100 [Flavobacteriaceae bacterium]|nr:hypothetical protein [Flavobacteriaceae bacterium]